MRRTWRASEWELEEIRALVAADTLAALVALSRADLAEGDWILKQAEREIATLRDFFGVRDWERFRG